MPYRRETYPTFNYTYAQLPAFEAHDAATLSEPNTIDFAFTPNEACVIDRDGRSEARAVPAMSGGAVGEVGFGWLRAPRPSEVVEVRPSPGLRKEIADTFLRPDLAVFDEVHGCTDPILYVLGMRFRAHALGGEPVSDLEGDMLVRRAVMRTIERAGGKPPRGAKSPLDGQRLARVAEFVEMSLATQLTTAILADVAAVSTNHFAVMFKRAVGVSPHAYATARRMEKARQLRLEGASVRAAAKAVGYANGHQFRATFSRHFGMLPSEVLAQA